MPPLTCSDVELELGLFVAHECDGPTEAAVAEHLASCPSCARARAEAERLLFLLDLQATLPDRLDRLHARLREEAAPRRRRARPFVLRFSRPIASLAALLLIAVGLGLNRGPFAPPAEHLPDAALVAELGEGPGLKAVPGARMHLETVKAGHRSMSQEAVVPAPGPDKRPAPPGPAQKAAPPTLAVVPMAAVEAGRRSGRLPPPPEVDLAVRLRNAGPGLLRVEVGGPSFDCWVGLSGPGAVTVPAPRIAPRPFPTATWAVLLPGQELLLPVDRLASQLGGEVRYAYATAPGEYAITIRISALATRGRMRAEQRLTLTAPAVKVQAEKR